MPTFTPNYDFEVPVIGADDDSWGGFLNDNWTLVDGLLAGTATITPDLGAGWKIGGVAVTATAAELNLLDGVTATTAELNLLDGVTATTAELNILDGVTATAGEINLLGGKALSGADASLVTGTAGTDGQYAQWNADGDVVGVDLPAETELSQVQVEDDTDTTFGLVSGERLAQAAAAAGMPAPDYTGEVGPGFPAASTNTTLNHGLGAIPRLVVAYAECTTAHRGFSVGERVVLASHYSTNNSGMTLSLSATQIRWIQGNISYGIAPDTNLFFTLSGNSSFKLVVEAWK